MANINPLNMIPVRRGNVDNVDAALDISSAIENSTPYQAAEIAHYTPYMLKEFYDETPVAEIAAETLTPWQYKSYKDSTKAGKEYSFDPSAFAADTLEMLGPTAPVVCGVEAMDNALDDGESYDTAVSRALGVGGGVGIASAIPLGGKLLKFGEKLMPHMAKAAGKVFPKVATPASLGSMMVAPGIIEGAYANNDEQE